MTLLKKASGDTTLRAACRILFRFIILRLEKARVGSTLRLPRCQTLARPTSSGQPMPTPDRGRILSGIGDIFGIAAK